VRLRRHLSRALFYRTAGEGGRFVPGVKKMMEYQGRLIDMIDSMCDGTDVLFHSVRDVKDIMTCDVKTLTLDDSIETCLEVMTVNNIRHVPIVDTSTKNDKSYFVGIVSQRDVFRQLSPFFDKVGQEDTDTRALNQHLEKIVTRHPKCASPDTPIQEATGMMVNNRIDSIPVLDDGDLVGIVTATDVLKLFIRLRAIGLLCENKNKTEPRRRFIDLLSGDSEEAINVLSTVLRTVEDVMTRDVVCLTERDHLSGVMKVMRRGVFRHVPVVNKEGKIVGIISDRDVLRLLPYRQGPRKSQTGVFREDLFDVEPDEPVVRELISRVMNQSVIHVRPDCDFYDAVKMLHDKRIGCLPVVDEEKKVLGIATVTDVMRGLLAAYALFEKTLS
jgi:acetoin utilization protein AcuB